MQPNLKFMKILPTINLSEDFIIEESAHTTLGEDWLAYANVLLDMAFDDSSDTFKSIKNKVKTRNSIFTMQDRAKSVLGIGSHFSVIDIGLDQDNKLKVTPLLDYEELIKIYFSNEKQSVYGSSRQAIVDRFFAFQWSRKKLLYPLTKIPPVYQRHADWIELAKNTALSNMIIAWFEEKSSSISRTVKYRKLAVFNILTSTQWYSQEEVTETDLQQIEKTIKDSIRKSREEREGEYVRTKTEKFQVVTINEIRYMLVNQGRKDIDNPRTIATSKRDEKAKTDKNGNLINRFEWLSLYKYPNLAEIKEFGDGFLIRIKEEGLAKGTIEGSISTVNNFLRYLTECYPHDVIDIKKVDEMFEPTNDKNIVSYYTKKKYDNRRSGLDEINKLIKFLVHCEFYSLKAKKNTPKHGRKVSVQPHRDAMPKDMVAHIVDIIKNRPLNTTTKWSRNKADGKWWKFDVYPVFPMLMLFGYFIPLRGEQVRNLCRANSFIFDGTGKIASFVINTDKNVNRKYLQEIPNVWDDLQIFVPFLKWHREYFPHLKKVKYHDDDNSPWEDIEPLMMLPNGQSPMNTAAHMMYHKKILCQYQLEIEAEAKANGQTHYPVVAWSKNKKPFFKNIKEIEVAGQKIMSQIGIAYDLHSLRVTGATRYLESGIGIKTVMELTGHMSPDTLIRIYIQLTRAEKETKLRSAVDKIYFGSKEDLIENSSSLIRGELTKAYNESKERLETAFDDNALFSMHRKASPTDRSVRLSLGTEIATQKHPTSWIPMIHGICPAVKCPEGREHKCSLCPYLITGKLFIEGVVHQANRAFVDFQRESIELEEENKKGYRNHSRSEGIETKLEEILGWQEILEFIKKDINKEDSDELEGDEELNLMKQKSLEVFGVETLATELVYLKNAYDAKLIGVEQDRYGLKVLAIRAMKIAAAKGDKEQFDLVANEDTKVIDMLMEYYTNEVEHTQKAKEFITSIGILPKSID